MALDDVVARWCHVSYQVEGDKGCDVKFSVHRQRIFYLRLLFSAEFFGSAPGNGRELTESIYGELHSN